MRFHLAVFTWNLSELGGQMKVSWTLSHASHMTVFG